MAKWEKIGRTVSAEGTTVIYRLQGTPMTVESRLRHIPHAAGKVGYMGKTTWDHTTYFVLDNGTEVKELYRLQDAKEYAEKLFIAEVLA